ncbi:hypothetical protein LCGC14_2028250 [marine sediment metagenome]|uniref:Uncharacterized protein n=1 Tax=marine sediment metagenome TaxID=412755 RepID=A0A0F9EVB7_9ZZZZ
MKKNLIKKIFLIGFLSITIFSAFLTPTTTAQVRTYNGADTERFPYHSMYPSEVYEVNLTFSYGPSFIVPRETIFRRKFVHGNESFLFWPNVFTSQKGYAVWGDSFEINATTGLVLRTQFDIQLAFYNASIPNVKYYSFLPVDINGFMSPITFNNVADSQKASGNYSFGIRYPNINSFHFWNTTNNYLTVNYTDDGILKEYQQRRDSDLLFFSISLMSQPARLPPEFSFTAEDDIANITSPNIKIDVDITDADNNNDGDTDTDYLYRIFDGSAWSNWTTIPALIDYDLGSVPSGNYDIIIEVKNMYGITQEQISIQYTKPTTEGIPGYSTILIAILLFFSASIILFRHQKKSKYHK